MRDDQQQAAPLGPFPLRPKALAQIADSDLKWFSMGHQSSGTADGLSCSLTTLNGLNVLNILNSLLGRQVIDRRVRSKFRIKLIAAAISNQSRCFAVGVFEIAEGACLGHAIGGAGGLESFFKARRAKVTLGNDAFLMALITDLFEGRGALFKIVTLFCQEEALIVGTGHHAIAAADALLC